MKEYVIHWYGGFRYNDLMDQEGEANNPENTFYAISHEPLGYKPITMYIGHTTRTIRERFRRHRKDDRLYDQFGDNELRYYTGAIVTDGFIPNSEIQNIEKSMIFAYYNHSDALDMNERNTGSYSGNDLRIKHTGTIPPRLQDFEIRNSQITFLEYRWFPREK